MEISNTSSCPVTATQESSNYDELLMRHRLLFADNLKELKDLTKQLYSAADYFEVSYSNGDHKPIVVKTIKDYITKAMVSTVDHLGSVADKVTNFLDEKVHEFSGADLQFSCIEQRSQACRELTDRISVSQQSLLETTAPKYHKKYIIRDVQATRVEPRSPLSSCSTFRGTPCRKWHSRLPPSSPGSFSFAKIVSNKELDPPQWFQLKRSGTVVRNSIIPNSSNATQPYPVELWRSASVSTNFERSMSKEMQRYSKKNRPLFRALISMLKQKKDGKLHT